jgi:hypothetical protein
MSFLIIDRDRLYNPFRLRPDQIDRQKPVLEIRTQYLHAVCQHEGALELARGDAAVEILAGLVLLLASADDELAFLDRHVELIAGETRNRQGDPQPFVWDYWGTRGWTELSVRDATMGLKQTGLVQFVGAPDALPRDGLGGPHSGSLSGIDPISA